MARRLRSELYRQLEPQAWRRAGLSPVNRALVALILASVALAVLETEPSLGAAFHRGLGVAQVLIGGVFLAEYVVRIWIAPEDPRYAERFGRLRYALSWPALVDLLALAPAFLLVGGGEAYLLRMARLLRILRIARLGRFSRASARLIAALAARRFEFAVTLAFGGVLMLLASTLLYLVEGSGQPEAFGSIPRAMWWSIATLTTVGYGDVTPITPLGRVFAGATAVVGIGVIAMPAGIVAAALGEAMRPERRPTVRPQAREDAAPARN
ncbi:potassium channel family protein [Rubrimonas cliftonensis]|uniref:Voltage-gated potassium channel n=1 Tax=Rubrimonas cliftonensis TaxID=89524 RepID=A0A1H3XH78_9RHOB|nr:potassium channel family protein [Rubrimonas cliftonensis]SDZ98014.1 voltage-gated potassium channel [Rubrimonas cliftonensis]